MTISLVASDGREDAEGGSPNDGMAELTLSGTEGNLQIVFATHRSSTQTPSIDGTGWSAAQLIETQIANGSARRAIVGWWRVVPAAAAALINAGWTADPGAVVGVAFEFATDAVGGTWSFDGWNSSDNGTSGTTSLASGSVTPANNEAAAVVGLCARNGDVAAEDSYDNSFLTGPSSTSGAGANQLSGFSGYRIVDTTPAATSTTASWTTSALATSLIAAVSVSSGATTPEVTASIPLTLDVAPQAQAEHSATAGIDLSLDVAAEATATHEVQASIPLTLDVSAAVSSTPSVVASIPLTLGLAATAQAQHDASAAIGLTLDLAAVTQAPGVANVQAAISLALGIAPQAATQHSATAAIPLTLALSAVSGEIIEPESVVIAQGIHSLIATAAGTFQLVATAGGIHDLIVEAEGAL